MWKYGYDPADQLTLAVKHATDTNETVLQRFAYAYDAAGNRTVEQIDDVVTLSAYDNLNRLTSQAPGGPMVIAGTLNEPGTVTISGKPAIVDANNNFRGTVPTTTGTNSFTIVGRDATGNTTTQQYEVDVAGTGRTFTFDANGNLTSDRTRTFEWDARNQLLAVTVGTHRSEFTYDGKQRRVRVIEKENGVTQTDTNVLWCDKQICEQRAIDGTTVTRRTFALGEQVAGTPRFFTLDHLGSIGEVTDSTNTMLARYAFDPWGRRTLAAGADVTAVGFTGHWWQSSADLWLTQYRQLDSGMGRWTSEDPIGFEDGVNLYSYVRNTPVNLFDPSGLQAATATWPWIKLCVDGAKAASGVLMRRWESSSPNVVMGARKGTTAVRRVIHQSAPWAIGSIASRRRSLTSPSRVITCICTSGAKTQRRASATRTNGWLQTHRPHQARSRWGDAMTSFRVIEINIRAHPSTLAAQWSPEKRELFLLDEAVRNPLSVDDGIWPKASAENQQRVCAWRSWRSRRCRPLVLSKSRANQLPRPNGNSWGTTLPMPGRLADSRIADTRLKRRPPSRRFGSHDSRGVVSSAL